MHTHTHTHTHIHTPNLSYAPKFLYAHVHQKFLHVTCTLKFLYAQKLMVTSSLGSSIMIILITVLNMVWHNISVKENICSTLLSGNKFFLVLVSSSPLTVNELSNTAKMCIDNKRSLVWHPLAKFGIIIHPKIYSTQCMDVCYNN